MDAAARRQGIVEALVKECLRLAAEQGASRDCASCLAAGMDDSVSKPLALADLRRVLDHWLSVPTPVLLPGVHSRH